MREWDFEICQVVDIDRQLLALEVKVVGATSLLQRAGERNQIGLFQRSPLSREGVLFLESEIATLAGLAVVS